MKLPVYIFLSTYASVGIDNLEDAKPGDLILTNLRDWNPDYLLVGEAEVEVDFRQKKDIASDMVNNILRKKQELEKDYEAKMRKIEDQLANMLAITYES